MSNFEVALEAAHRAVELFEGGPEATNEFHIKGDPATGALTIKGYTVYLRDEGPSRVMAGRVLVGSYSDPVEAVIETMGHVIADRTKHVLREFLSAEANG